MKKFKTYILIQSKGGSGKSHIARMAVNYAIENQKTAVFYNCDNESKTLSLFFEGIKDIKPSKILFKDYNLLVDGKKFDTNKFDFLLSEIAELEKATKQKNIDFAFIDMGARSSTEFVNYLNSRGDLTEMLINDYNFVFLPILAGGNTYTECKAYLDTFNQQLVKNSILVCNTFNGKIESKDIKHYFPTPEFEMSALEDFKLQLSKGFTPASIKENTNIFRYKAFRQYFDECNAFFDKLLKM